jgi:hypothetical protein
LTIPQVKNSFYDAVEFGPKVVFVSNLLGICGRITNCQVGRTENKVTTQATLPQVAIDGISSSNIPSDEHFHPKKHSNLREGE